MKILFVLAFLMMKSVWAQESFFVTQKNQNILKSLDKNKFLLL